MSKDEVTGFFQRALEERKQNGGILKFEVVRSNLLKHFQKASQTWRSAVLAGPINHCRGGPRMGMIPSQFKRKDSP